VQLRERMLSPSSFVRGCQGQVLLLHLLYLEKELVDRTEMFGVWPPAAARMSSLSAGHN